MTLSQSMLHMARAYRASADQMLAELGLSQATAWPLFVIRRLGAGVRQKQVADELGIEAPSLVRLLDRLQANGLIERQADPSDARGKTLHLTASGKRIASDIEKRLIAFRREVFAGVPTQDAEAFLRVLGQIKLNTGNMYAGKHKGGRP